MAGAGNDDAKLAGAFRPDRRPFLVMIVANVALAVVFLGVPWLRERTRATEARVDFARFAACLYGGEARAEPGLGLPVGDTAHFAFQALRAGSEWPARCRAPLLAIAPEEARFLLPSASAAEEDVRRAVDLVRRELDAFAMSRGGAARVATRPLRAVELLRAKLAQMVEASGADRGMAGDALRFTRAGALAEPTRLPLRAAAEGPLYVEARGDGLVAFGLDARGLGVVRLGAGTVDVRRIPRPRGVTAFIHGRSVSSADNAGPGLTIPWLLSVTPEARCADDPSRCARRTMGVAAIARDATVAPSPWHLAAHPWGGAPADTVRVLGPAVSGGPPRLAVLARTVDAGPELRVFTLDAESPATRPLVAPLVGSTGAGSTGAAPAAPARIAALRQALDVGGEEVRAARLLADGRPVLLVTAGESMRALVFDAEGRTSRVLAEVGGTEGAMLRLCESGETLWLALGSVSEARLVRVQPDAPPPGADAPPPGADAAPPGAGAPQPPVADAPPPGADDVALAQGEAFDDARAALSCDGEGALLVAPLRSGGARLLACGGAAGCGVGALRELPRTAAVAAARDGGIGVVSYSVLFGAVHVVRVDRRGAALGASVIPAACWEDGTGLCGAPQLAARNGRVLLVTREGTDLRALETVDGAATWGPLRGLD